MNTRILGGLLLLIGFSKSYAGIVPAALNENKIARIVGGVETEKSEFPFMVSLQAGEHFCGASLIAPQWVLTAAHCVEDGILHKIVLGLHDQTFTSDTEVRRPLKIIVHPGYLESGYNNDVALIKLDRPSTYAPITLRSEELSVSTETTLSTVMGWGLLNDEATTQEEAQYPALLQKVEVPLVSKEVCNAKNSYDGMITDDMLCAGFKDGGKDSCSADSGGPLITQDAAGNPTLIGIVSFGDGCARPNKYGVYAKVSSHYTWIMENIEKNESTQTAAFH